MDNEIICNYEQDDYLPVSSLCVGDSMFEADGFMFGIISHERTKKGYRVVVASDFSSFKNHHEINGGTELFFGENDLVLASKNDA